jgi:hypothetical protein
MSLNVTLQSWSDGFAIFFDHQSEVHEDTGKSLSGISLVDVVHLCLHELV